MRYAAALEVFQQSILTGDAEPALPLVKPKPHFTPGEQLSIYIDGYRIRLMQAVRGDYPALARYLGDAALDPLIHAYVEATKSHSYNLNVYGFGFAKFLRGQGASPEACDLAGLESAIAETFMMPGSAPLALGDMGGIGDEDLGETRLKLRTASRLLALPHDVETYMQQFKRDEAGDSIAVRQTHLLVYRHGNQVKRARLDAAEYGLLRHIAEGLAFGEAVERVINAGLCTEEALAAQIGAWLPKWIGEGFFTKPSA